MTGCQPVEVATTSWQLVVHQQPQSMKTSVCEICRDIPDFASAALREGESLPDNVSKLIDAYPSPEVFWDTTKDYEITKKCPLCGSLYIYNYHYEFSVGYIEESVWIERQKDSEPSG